VVKQPQGEISGGKADILLLIGENNVVDPSFADTARFAARHLAAGEVLELQRHMFEDVAHPGALAHPLQEATGPAE